MHTDIVKPTVYGLMAEFETPEDLTEAARKTIDGGYTKLDAYTPFPVEELSELVASVRQKFHVLPLLVLGAGITGVTVAYLMQYYIAAVDVPIFQFWRIVINGYPMNLGSRALNSWPAFTVVMFEMTVLFSAGAAVFGMLGLNYLPMPYHPVFNVERFSRASSDKFFLCIEAIDPNFDLRRTKQFLEGLKPVGIVEEVATSEIPDKEIEWPEL